MGTSGKDDLLYIDQHILSTLRLKSVDMVLNNNKKGLWYGLEIVACKLFNKM